ncbi:protein PHYTOCHROME KINASE SUBSTRATE 4 [Melia azedarach]|uniref:Protein PHYTOCHROME KINASE SUBSTRATE 4 n=1 Tax=Melia azedarach TaxID=155640 RepID=A0ACC1X3D0_MELAZ|nr:protein PHYTOCHROME KINASE SUBSTRATE 4 [Melia azedarach]
MERSTVMIKNDIHGRLPQPPIDQHSNSHLPYVSFSPKTTFTDASFSAYLRPADHRHHHQADDSEISIFDAQKYFNESSSCSTFDAKLSNRVSPVNVVNNLERISEQRSSTDFSAAIPRFSSASSTDGYGRNYRARSFNATPTASSEASWNSQTGLLSNPPGAIPVSMRNPATEHHDKKRGSSSGNWLFGRKCPCSGKKSVQVEEKLSVSEPKTAVRLYNNRRHIQKSLEATSLEKTSEASNREWSRTSEAIIPNGRRISAENRFSNLNQRVIASGRPYGDGTGFTFPILNQNSSMKLVVNSLSLNANSATPPEDPPRKSLEIFQPPSEETVSRKSTDNQNRTLVSRQGFTFPASPSRTRMTSITDDDVASDASSDLFEIESFSTQTTSYPMYHRRDSLDEASSFNARRLAAATNASIIYRAQSGRASSNGMLRAKRGEHRLECDNSRRIRQRKRN